jgi:hypothetical protein
MAIDMVVSGDETGHEGSRVSQGADDSTDAGTLLRGSTDVVAAQLALEVATRVSCARVDNWGRADREPQAVSMNTR